MKTNETDKILDQKENRETIRIHWNDIKSIKQSERKKARFENAGYTLISSFGGMNETVMIYQK
jgi:hypothetical protein